jgi:hypothetical protein
LLYSNCEINKLRKRKGLLCIIVLEVSVYNQLPVALGLTRQYIMWKPMIEEGAYLIAAGKERQRLSGWSPTIKGYCVG